MQCCVFWLSRNLDNLSRNHKKRHVKRHASYTRDTLISAHDDGGGGRGGGGCGGNCCYYPVMVVAAVLAEAAVIDFKDMVETVEDPILR